MTCQAIRSSRAFSLIELVIVVVIIGIIAAIAVPRMSRGAAGANESAVRSNVAMMRKALELYAAEHNNTYPTTANVGSALLNASDASGAIKSTGTTTQADATFPFGPYLRSIPSVGGAITFNVTATRSNTGGWFYPSAATGDISVNLTGNDSAGTAWSTY